MKSVLKSMLSSKKFIATLISSGVWSLGKLGLHIDDATLAGIVAPFLVYILGQGVADNGKPVAKIEAAALVVLP